MEKKKLDFLLARIEGAGSTEKLGRLRKEMREQIRLHLPHEQPADCSRSINEMQDALMKRAIKLAQTRISDRGLGKPPVPYAFLLFGSGGRREQTLWSDQDNGLVYDNPPPSLRLGAEVYFSELSREICLGLESAGFAPCEGKVLCERPMWRKSLDAWGEQLGGWYREADWESVRHLLVAADMRILCGDSGLFGKLGEKFHSPIAKGRAHLQSMLKNTLHRKVALGVFGQLIKERYGEEAGGVEVKYGVYIPIVNAVRLLAIGAGIRDAHSTAERISVLSDSGYVPPELAEDWMQALTIALKLRSLAPASGVLPAEELTAERKVEIKFCLHTGKALQNYVKKRIQDDAGRIPTS